MPHQQETTVSSAGNLTQQFVETRNLSEKLCEPLDPEDFCLQTMADASPPKWHLAHTSWFFERFLLLPFCAGYEPYNQAYFHLFNSYYETIGSFHPRPQRGLLTRPNHEEVMTYRKRVTEACCQLLATDLSEEATKLFTVGIHHEMQHQELLLTDLKYGFFCNPLLPSYSLGNTVASTTTGATAWLPIAEGVYSIGATGEGFSYDNERGRHKVYLAPVQLGSWLITNGEFLQFIEDGGYDQVSLWLSDGWSQRQKENWQAPLYWVKRNGCWYEFTLSGLRPLVLEAPVCHVSYYEADAYARWAGCRIASEAEWEVLASGKPVSGNFLDQKTLHPQPGGPGEQQFFGDCWEWTQSSYLPYPGFKPFSGNLGEYNGKFMCNQMVLRGGSCVTPQTHIRASYRNFFYPASRWQFSGIRLAKEKL